jgi:glycosyltransferase involved in cell wall biosynthesis
MKITVVTPTYSFFMKECQLDGLMNQTFKDFEWVVVDGCYEKNKDFKTPFPLIHIPPSNPVPYFSLASSLNDGLARASGKYVFFMSDYIAPRNECLGRHWELQERFGGCILSGRDICIEGYPAMCNRKEIKVQDYRMALFETGTIPSITVDENVREIGREGIQNWFAGHNDSCPLEALLACNGFDEAFDGCWGGQDAEMANRLMTYGLKYYLDSKSECVAYPHERGAKKKSYRTEAEQQSLQYKIINPKVEQKVYTANTSWLVMIPRNMKGEWDANRRID